MDTFTPRLPWTHWVVVVVALASAWICLGRKRIFAYGAVALGLTSLTSLYLLDALALAHYWGIVPFGPFLSAFLASQRLPRQEAGMANPSWLKWVLGGEWEDLS